MFQRIPNYSHRFAVSEPHIDKNHHYDIYKQGMLDWHILQKKVRVPILEHEFAMATDSVRFLPSPGAWFEVFCRVIYSTDLPLHPPLDGRKDVGPHYLSKVPFIHHYVRFALEIFGGLGKGPHPCHRSTSWDDIHWTLELAQIHEDNTIYPILNLQQTFTLPRRS